jgi:hypothetical protein
VASPGLAEYTGRMLPTSLIVSLLLACGSPSSPPQAPAISDAVGPDVGEDAEGPAAKGELAPIPFTADVLQAGMPKGTRMMFGVTQADGRVIRMMEVVESDATKVGMMQGVRTPEGKTLEQPKKVVSTWQELETHGHFPAENTKRVEEKVKVAAGEYDSWHYTVTNPADSTMTKEFWFAKELPGPPVLMEAKKAEMTGMRMELISRELASAE